MTRHAHRQGDSHKEGEPQSADASARPTDVRTVEKDIETGTVTVF